MEAQGIPNPTWDFENIAQCAHSDSGECCGWAVEPAPEGPLCATVGLRLN